MNKILRIIAVIIAVVCLVVFVVSGSRFFSSGDMTQCVIFAIAGIIFIVLVLALASE